MPCPMLRRQRAIMLGALISPTASHFTVITRSQMLLFLYALMTRFLISYFLALAGAYAAFFIFAVQLFDFIY